MVIPVILYVIFGLIDSVLNGEKGTFQFSILFLIALFITIPLQSIAEEYMFRGLAMQTLGSWFKIPVLALIIQAVIFALSHGYNTFGLFEILVNGLMWGFFAWKTGGLEVCSALHTANNFSVGLLVMFGMHTLTSSPQLSTVLAAIVFQLVLCAIMYYVGNKTNWFGISSRKLTKYMIQLPILFLFFFFHLNIFFY